MIIALLANALATAGGLYVLIETFEPVSGAHFNPVVSLVLAGRTAMPRSLLAPYVLAQLTGAMLGAWLANAMFDVNILQSSTKIRGGTGQWIGEVVATAGLLLIVLRAPAGRVAAMVACYIGAAYRFTSSTSFANPAAAFGRMFSDSFDGISPSSVPGFVAAELVGAALGWLVHAAMTTSSHEAMATPAPDEEPSLRDVTTVASATIYFSAYSDLTRGTCNSSSTTPRRPVRRHPCKCAGHEGSKPAP